MNETKRVVILHDLYRAYKHGAAGSFSTNLWNTLPKLHINDHDALRTAIPDHIDTHAHYSGKSSQTAPAMLHGQKYKGVADVRQMFQGDIGFSGASMVLLWQYVEAVTNPEDLKVSREWQVTAYLLCNIFTRADLQTKKRLTMKLPIYEPLYEYLNVPGAHIEIFKKANEELGTSYDRFYGD